MLSVEQNRKIALTGPGTAAGRLLRSYWQPIAQSSQVAENCRPYGVTVMSEDLVIYRDADGTPHLVGARCPHRGTSLTGGRVEPRGIRCCYHGWLFDGTGQCLEQPCEPPGSRFADKVRIPAYEVIDRYGLIWAFMGEGAPPTLPPFDILARPDGHRVTTELDWNCNYFQVAENFLDPFHTAFLHPQTQLEAAYEVLPEVRYEETEWGLRSIADRPDYHRELEVLFPNGVRFSLPMMRPQLEEAFWVVPIDDERTRSFHVWFVPMADDLDPRRRDELIRKMYGFIYETNPNDRVHGSSKVIHQDRFACESQGILVDRSDERLGVSDRGIILMRQRLMEAMDEVAAGRDPRGLTRAPIGDVIHFANVQ